MNIKKVLFSTIMASLIFGNIQANFGVMSAIIAALSSFSASYLIDQKKSFGKKERPRINVSVYHNEDGTTSLVRSGQGFTLHNFKTDNETPVVIEDNKGNFSVTTAGEFDGLMDVFLTDCRNSFPLVTPDGKHIDAFIIQPLLDKWEHFNSNNHRVCDNPKIIQAVLKFQKTRQTNTKKE